MNKYNRSVLQIRDASFAELWVTYMVPDIGMVRGYRRTGQDLTRFSVPQYGRDGMATGSESFT